MTYQGYIKPLEEQKNFIGGIFWTGFWLLWLLWPYTECPIFSEWHLISLFLMGHHYFTFERCVYIKNLFYLMNSSWEKVNFVIPIFLNTFFCPWYWLWIYPFPAFVLQNRIILVTKVITNNWFFIRFSNSLFPRDVLFIFFISLWFTLKMTYW